MKTKGDGLYTLVYLLRRQQTSLAQNHTLEIKHAGISYAMQRYQIVGTKRVAAFIA
mgnify:CR=1 FL=1|jgi:hypothetical protein